MEGPAGQPLGGVLIETRARPDWKEEPFHAFARAFTAPDGRFTLAPLDELAYDVVVLRSGKAVAAAERVKAGTGDLVLHQLPAGRLRGTVREAESASPISSFSVVLLPARGGVARQQSAYTRYDARGEFEIDELPAGDYRVLVVGKGYAPSESLPVQVRPGETATLSFTLGRGGRVHGQVINRLNRQPIAGAQVSLEGRRAGAASMLPLSAATVTDATGRFEIVGAPPGRRSLLATAAGHHGRLLGGLDAAEGKDVGPVSIELTPTRPGELPRVEIVGIGAMFEPVAEGLVVRKVMPGSVAAEAGLAAGDVVLAIDGSSLHGMSAEDAIQRIRGPEGSEISLLVRRAADGNTVDVQLVRRAITPPGRL